MAAIYDRFMDDMERACGDAWRKELLRDVRGDVLEIGAGTGRNLDHYPRDLGRLVLAEPDPHMRRKLAAKVATMVSLAPHIDLVDWAAERLDRESGSFDVVVCTLVLCSVPDPRAALLEIARVLRPGGRLVFLEHVASTDPGRLAWQRRLEPMWRRVAGNCHLHRDTESAIEAAGFHIDSVVRESARKALPIVRPMIRGAASLRSSIGPSSSPDRTKNA